MAKAIYSKTVTDNTGKVQPGAEYDVIDEITGLPLTIYSDREGLITKTPPYFSSSDGLIEFYVNPGVTFRVEVVGGPGSKFDRYQEGRLFGSDNGKTPFASEVTVAIESNADFPAVTVGQRISTAGYHPSTTVGGGELVGNASARHDGVIYFDPDRKAEIGTAAYYVDSGVDVPCWERVGTLAISFRMAGAKGDGVFDDYPAVQKTIEISKRVEGHEGDVHYISSDVHFYSDQVIDFNGSQLKTDLDMFFMLRNHNIDASGYNGDTNTVIRGLVVDAGSLPISTGAIGIAHTSNCTIEDCIFLNFEPTGGIHVIDMPGNKNLTIRNNRVVNHQNSTTFQIDQAATGSMPTFTTPNLNEDGTGCKSVAVIGNYFELCDLACVHLHKDSHSNILITQNEAQACGKLVVDDNNYTTQHSRVTITENLVDARNGGGGNGVVMYAGYIGLNISNNTIKTFFGAAIVVDGTTAGRDSDQVVISGNIIDADNNSAIYFRRGKRVSITDNQIEDYGDGSTRYGIYLERVFTASVIGNSINSFGNTGRVGVNLFECLAVNVHSNNIVRCAFGVKSSSANSSYNGAGISICNNTINDATEDGIAIDGVSTSNKARGMTINGNNIEDVTKNGISFDFVSGSTVSANMIRDCGASFGGINATDCNTMTINNNVILNNAQIANGIRLNGSGYSTISSNRIDNAVNGVLTSGSSNFCAVVGNVTTLTTTPVNLVGASNQVANNI